MPLLLEILYHDGHPNMASTAFRVHCVMYCQLGGRKVASLSTHSCLQDLVRPRSEHSFRDMWYMPLQQHILFHVGGTKSGIHILQSPLFRGDLKIKILKVSFKMEGNLVRVPVSFISFDIFTDLQWLDSVSRSVFK